LQKVRIALLPKRTGDEDFHANFRRGITEGISRRQIVDGQVQPREVDIKSGVTRDGEILFGKVLQQRGQR
jgi:hypothetical protein